MNAASDFNDVIEAFGYEELPYVGGAAPRTSVVGRIFTANESPPDQKIPFHHEMAQRKSGQQILESGKVSISRGAGDLGEKLSGISNSQMEIDHPKPKVKLKNAPEIINPVKKSVKADTTVSGTKKVANKIVKKSQQKVDMAALIHMTNEDLKAMGIPMAPSEFLIAYRDFFYSLKMKLELN